jgi:AcrR family transcriptional regulator
MQATEKQSQTEDRRQTSPRRPVQKRSRERVESLLDATDALLAVSEAGDFGLYDIAKQAKVPPASVYHFFPTKEAAFVALAERYLARLNAVSHKTPIDTDKARHWSDVFRAICDRVIDFYDANPNLLKLFFGSALSPQIHGKDLDYVKQLNQGGYAWLNRYLELPEIANAEQRFSIVWAIFDGITGASYGLHLRVTAGYRAEIHTAIAAYVSTFLKDDVPIRRPALEVA